MSNKVDKKTAKKAVRWIVILIILFAVFIFANPLYIVNENEAVVITEIGKIVKTETEPGLHVRIPFIHQIHRYTRRLLRIDGDPQKIPTKENQFIEVDTTSRWRITDAKAFYESLVTRQAALPKLANIIDSSVRDIISVNSFDNIVRNSNIINETSVTENFNVDNDEIEIEALGFSENMVYPTITKGRDALSEEILVRANTALKPFGVEVVDVIFKGINYSNDLQSSVFQRMITERNQIAESFRSAGEGKKAEFLGKLSNEKKTILSKAYSESERIKGLADAEASAIYAKAYSKNPEFYSFWKSLEVYKKTLPDTEKILSTDAEYFKYIYKH